MAPHLVKQKFIRYLDNSTQRIKIIISLFLIFQGTQSSNPHNDYCQHFVDTGQRPQNFIRDVGLADRFEEYPKLRELIKLKDELIALTATPPMYLKCDLKVIQVQLFIELDINTKGISTPQVVEVISGCCNIMLWIFTTLAALSLSAIYATVCL